MRLVLNYCNNCGIEYTWVASGSMNIEYFSKKNKYGTAQHCYECNLIVEHFENLKQNELSKIEKKTIVAYIPTDEVTLEMLKEWEKLTDEENKGKFLMKRVFASYARFDSSGNYLETEIKGAVSGREEFKKRNYFYSYWPSEPHKALITVNVRQDVKTSKILQYI